MSNLYIVTTNMSSMDRGSYGSRQTIMADKVNTVDKDYVFEHDGNDVAWFPSATVISVVNKGCLADDR